VLVSARFTEVIVPASSMVKIASLALPSTAARSAVASLPESGGLAASPDWLTRSMAMSVPLSISRRYAVVRDGAGARALHFTSHSLRLLDQLHAQSY
jgi:hypothetical protein